VRLGVAAPGDARPAPLAAAKGLPCAPSSSPWQRPRRPRCAPCRYESAPAHFGNVVAEVDDDVLRQRLRAEAGLRPGQALRANGESWKQADAVELRHSLLESGVWSPAQLGLFSKEAGDKGVRKFFVDTYADFSMDRASGGPGNHFYEVIQRDQPCWLYFDLEFPKLPNPQLRPEEVMAQFRRALAHFCEREGFNYSEPLTVVLDSSTEVKFSAHVIVKSLAFANNYQAGMFVDMFVEYTRHAGEAGSRIESLFAREGTDDAEATKSVVDCLVYSANRCFRVLGQSKRGKSAVLRLQDGGDVVRESDPAAIQVLRTLASFVPEGTATCQHPKILEGAAHRSRGAIQGADVGDELKPLLDYLAEMWDEERGKVEGFNHPPTVVESVREFPGIPGMLFVKLGNNRFCLRRGRSHKANHVYLVVNLRERSFSQRCWDHVDCPRVGRSASRGRPKRFRIPPEVLPPRS